MHQAGQRLWLDSISRELLASGRLRHYIQEFSVTGLTSNPTIRRIDAGQGPLVGSVASLLFASTSTKDPDAPDTLYISALAAPDTINTMPEKTLEAFADHGTVGDLLAPDGGDADEVLAQFDRAGVEVAALAAKLQSDGEQSFDASWDSLLAALERTMARLGGTP